MGMFAKAKPIATPQTAKAKSEKIEVPIAQLQQLAEIQALIVSLTSAAKSISEEVKTAGFEQFLALEAQTRPDSFRGTDGFASASVEMRKRGTNSALTDEEVQVLANNGIVAHKQIVVNELFAINPKYADDKILLGKVEKSLAKIVPEDFIVQQAEVSKFVVSEEMLNQAFKIRDRACIEITTTMALKPSLSAEYPMDKLFENVQAIVQPKKIAKKSVMPGAKHAA